jgi:hypothetical protein
LYGAQQALITVRLLRMTNYVTLYKALGGGFDNPVKEEAPAPAGEGKASKGTADKGGYTPVKTQG